MQQPTNHQHCQEPITLDGLIWHTIWGIKSKLALLAWFCDKAYALQCRHCINRQGITSSRHELYFFTNALCILELGQSHVMWCVHDRLTANAGLIHIWRTAMSANGWSLSYDLASAPSAHAFGACWALLSIVLSAVMGAVLLVIAIKYVPAIKLELHMRIPTLL